MRTKLVGNIMFPEPPGNVSFSLLLPGTKRRDSLT